jgi:hypothetical protein
MEQHILDDLNNIFDNRLNNGTMIILNDNFDLIFAVHPNIFRIRTRNEKNEILSYHGENYFSLVQISQESPVVFAGALARNLETEIVPAIRFRDENISLHDVPTRFKFPYRKPNWTYVEIQKETVSYFRNLFESQIRYHLHQ